MNINFNGCTVPRTSCKTNAVNTKSKNDEISARKANGLPSGITVDNSILCPNVKKHTVSELFDIQYQDAVKLSDGSVLVRPVILSLGEVDIKPSEVKKGCYDVSLNHNIYSNRTSDGMLIKEKELLENRSLCRGKIKQIDNDTYSVFFVNSDGEKRMVKTDKAGCLETLRENMLYI